jgi:hypothetical protein
MYVSHGGPSSAYFQREIFLTVFVPRMKTWSISDSVRPMDENRKFSWQCSSPRMKPEGIISDSVRLKGRKQEVFLTVFVLRMKTWSISDSVRPMDENRKYYFWQCSSQGRNQEVLLLTVLVPRMKTGRIISDSARPKDETRWYYSPQGWNQEVLFVPRMRIGSIISESVRPKDETMMYFSA